MSEKRTPTALIILDGWGHSDSDEHNAISAAKTPTWDRLWSRGCKSLIATSGLAVGLPEGQMGNSEVGHMNIGAGRIVYQNFTRISKSIADGDFFSNPSLSDAMDRAVEQGRAVHVMGLLSPGGVHSHDEHLQALCQMAAQRGARQIFVHAFLDGRDMPPRSAEPSIAAMEAKLAELGVGKIASVTGRYYAMDRDQRWERVASAYQAMVLGKGSFTARTAEAALAAAYERGEDDEFAQATVIVDAAGQAVGRIQDGDAVICANFRPDRARQISRAFVDPEFNGFERQVWPALAGYVMMTEYASDIPAAVAYPPQAIHNSLGEYLAAQGKTQLRIAETEKYAHVTFFFNGGQEEAYPGEERILVPSPQVATYDLQPEMSAFEVTEQLEAAIASQQYDLIVCNFANPDMVGHTGKLEAAVQAVEVVDTCLGRVVAALEAVGGQALITADHGNVELMANPETGQPHTAHTLLPVGLLYAGPQSIALDDGALCDLAPTLLGLMGLEVPAEMSGRSLLK